MMAEARMAEAWNHTAQVLCYLAEPYRDRKKRRRPFTPQEFHPYTARRRGRRHVSVARLTHEMMKLAEAKQKGR